MLRLLVGEPDRTHPNGLVGEVGDLTASIGELVSRVGRDPIGMLAADDLDVVISDDEQLHRAAIRAGVEPERMLSFSDAHYWLRTLANHPLPPLPPARSLALQSLTTAGRGLAELHPDCLEIGPAGSVWRHAEVVLQAILTELHQSEYSVVRVTSWPRTASVLALLYAFGFEADDGQLVKRLSPGGIAPLDSFDFHRRFGPPAMDLSLAPVFIAPTAPTLHRRLFLEADTQLRLPLGVEAPAEAVTPALRKGFLSRANIRRLPRGAIVLCYRSGDLGAITAAGVVEETLRSANAARLMRWLGPRSPHSRSEVEEYAPRRPLAVRFRHGFMLGEPIRRSELLDAGVLKRAPSAIMQVRGGGALRWLRVRIGAEIEANRRRDRSQGFVAAR